jgi:hypothetical protein
MDNRPRKKHLCFDFCGNQCCRFGMFIPDPKFYIADPGSRVKNIPDPGSASASKKLSTYFSLKKLCLCSRKSDLDFCPIPGPGSRGQKGTGPGSGSATLLETDSVVQELMGAGLVLIQMEMIFSGLRLRMGIEGVKN